MMETKYVKGLSFFCNHCNSDSVVTIKDEMDGWRCTGKYFSCALCGAKLANVPNEKINKSKNKIIKSTTNKIDTLFSGIEDNSSKKPKPTFFTNDTSGHFCRDCKYYIWHPFLSRCELHNQDADPMEDCPDFEKKQTNK